MIWLFMQSVICFQILARVIAAVVKFDSEQTSKVLQKEQQRLSLVGLFFIQVKD